MTTLSGGQDLRTIVNNPETFMPLAPPSAVKTPTKRMNGLTVDSPVKVENIGYDAVEGASPPKRPRRASANRVTPYISDGDAGADSDTSEYICGIYRQAQVDEAEDEDEEAG